MKTVTYVPGTFVTLVSGPYSGGQEGDRLAGVKILLAVGAIWKQTDE